MRSQLKSSVNKVPFVSITNAIFPMLNKASKDEAELLHYIVAFARETARKDKDHYVDLDTFSKYLESEGVPKDLITKVYKAIAKGKTSGAVIKSWVSL